ncbi:MAG: hypothetical protein U0794_18475 [Isosphaeraceae bacterium]
MTDDRPHLLPPDVHFLQPSLVAQVRRDYHRFAQSDWPAPIEDFLLDEYGLDVRATYAGLPLRNPWGLASGQLSMRVSQVESAIASGVGLIVLKTVIAQDAQGGQSMSAWAVKQSRMVVEPIEGRRTKARGWTVTWKGRGWWDSFEAYLDLVRASARLGRDAGVVIAPSVKYHLPGPDEPGWRVGEYQTTTQQLLDAFGAGESAAPMPIEKDFSPTLAGSDRAREHATTLRWLEDVPRLIREAAGDRPVRVGLKLMNAVDDDAFQLAMLEQVHKGNTPDFLIYANRLFDARRSFEGQVGVAYGGPDLSDRNLRLLSAFRARQARDEWCVPSLEISGTGDIHSGKMAVEYALRGCTSVQIHTLFQLPSDEFDMKRGDKIRRALHRLYFHPTEGLIVWLRFAAERLGAVDDGIIRWLDIARLGALGLERSFDPFAR